jgi:hypothetical protein
MYYPNPRIRQSVLEEKIKEMKTEMEELDSLLSCCNLFAFHGELLEMTHTIQRDSEHLLFMKDCAKSVEKDKKNLKQRLEDLEGFLRLTINEVDSS